MSDDKRDPQGEQPRVAADGYVIGTRIHRSASVAAAIDKQLAEGFRKHALKQAFKDSTDKEMLAEMQRRGYTLKKD